MENQIDELFRSRLRDAELLTSQDLWDHLEERMIRRRQQRYRIYYAAALILILLGTGLWLLLEPSDALPGQTNQPISKILEQPVKQKSYNEIVELIAVEKSEQVKKVTRKGLTVPVQMEYPQEVGEAFDRTSAQNESNVSEIDVVISDLPASAQTDLVDEPEVVVYELVSFEDTNTISTRQQGFIRAMMELKREGISIAPIRDLKNGLINRIFRNRQRNENYNTTYPITEQ